MMNSKKGISILAVLLFMLIATIAGTATYKWLSSEGKSSASRMFQSEARMAALAGIESARSWFATHGNEAGAVVKQVKNAKKKNTVVKLDNQLVAIRKQKQNYTVYVVDVDDSDQPYKIKVISEGTSRDGTAKHSETAVFKVSGLYQISVPVKTSDVDYNYAYFGGSTSMGTNTTVESMLVNGDLSGSQISVTDKLVVTGNVSDAGTNHMGLANTSCIGGNLTVSQQGLASAGDLYVAGNASKLTFSSNILESERIIKGSVYFGGNVTNSDIGGSVPLTIARNMTLANGTLTASDKRKFSVLGNMCLGENSQINFNDPKVNQGGFTVGGKVWIPGSYALYNSKANNYKGVSLGGVGYDAYISGASLCPNGGSYKEASDNLQVSTTKQDGYTDCPLDMYYQGKNVDGVLNPYALFSSNATIHSTVSESAAKDGVECSESVVETCTELLTPTSGTACTDGSKYKIDDLLQTASSVFKDKASTCVTNALNVDNNNLLNGLGIDKINNCFANADASDLYNGYLVVKAGAAKLSTVFGSLGGRKLKGKFIIYVDEAASSSIKLSGSLPATELNNGQKSIVFLYLPNGAGTLMKSGSGDHNYFVYSEGNISNLQTPSDGATRDWYGSFYLTASNCSKIDKVSDAQNFNYDAEIVTDLTNSGVICSASATSCGETGASSTSGGSSSTTGGSKKNTLDSVHVAVGSNLFIELESQYKATEKISGVEDVAPSVVVLPRVVYLNSNPEPNSKLSDYFNPIPLNGVGTLASPKVSCPNYSKLEQSTLPELDKGTYTTCTYTATSNSKSYKSEFYVVVLGAVEEIPKVGFDGDAYVIVDDSEVENGDVVKPVAVNIGGVSNGSGEYSMDIVVTGQSNWISEAKVSDKFKLLSTSGNTRRYHLTGNISSEESTVPLFDVTLTSGYSAGNVVFSIENVENCIPYASIKAIALRGSKTIVRKSLTDYCNLTGNDDPNCDTWKSSDYTDVPSCNNFIKNNFGNAYEWIAAYGDECSVFNYETELATNVNEKWRCYTGSSVNLIEKNSSALSDYCVVYKPDDSRNTIRTFDSENLYLYADVKHKAYKLHLELVSGTEGGHIGSVTVYSSVNQHADIAELEEAFNNNNGVTKTTCSDASCTITVYAGYHLYLKGNGSSNSNFSYWEIPKNAERTEYKKEEGNPYHVQVSEDVWARAVFNVVSRCFYDNFEGTEIFCSGDQNKENCIDKCSTDSKDSHCSVTSGHSYTNAHWTMVYANTPSQVEECVEYKNNGRCKTPIKTYFEKIAGNSDQGLHYGSVYDFWNSKTYDGDGINDGRESVVLNKVDAGTDGVLTASFKTAEGSLALSGLANLIGAIFNKKVEYLEKRFLNSGFILRSNSDATEYFTLNIFQMNVTGISGAGGYTTHARVCYVNKNNTASPNTNAKTLTTATGNCTDPVEVKFKDAVGEVTTAFNKINVEATLKGDVLTVKLGTEQLVFGSSWYMDPIEFNLKTLFGTSLNNPEKNKYVGFKLADKAFKLYDIAWRSDAEMCWDTPYVSCSFAANYVGGRVPLEQDAMPWVTTSTWLSDKVTAGACSITYYYNGCDMDKNRYNQNFEAFGQNVINFFGGYCSDHILSGQTEISADGYYWGTADGEKNGTPLRPKTNYQEAAKYAFKYEGIHGKEVSTGDGYAHDGIIRNASVIAKCPGLKMKRTYLANCGEFWVGPINECTDDEALLPYGDGEYKDGFSYSGDGVEKELVLEKTVNLRSASLQFKFSEGSGAQFYLESENGKTSSWGSVSAERTEGVEIDDKIIDVIGFDPQNVTKIVFKSDESFTITEIKSECANAPKAKCSSAEYDAEEGVWRLYGSASGETCKLTLSYGSNELADQQVVCRSEGSMVLSTAAAKTFAEGIKENTTVDVQLSVTNLKTNTSVTCATTASVAPASTAASVSPKPRAESIKRASCSKSEDGSYHVVVNGCDSRDNCSVKTQRNDYPPEVACNWVTSDCYVALYYPGTYDILFNDGSSDHRLAGCSGIVFTEGENNE